jgi:hypothetical protein
MPSPDEISGTETRVWTLATVKALLPPVRLRIGTQQYTGTIAGRQLPSATVYVGETGYPFSWHAIIRALNTGTPLSVPTPQGRGQTAHPHSLAREGDDDV